MASHVNYKYIGKKNLRLNNNAKGVRKNRYSGTSRPGTKACHSRKTLTELYLYRMALRGSNLQTAILRMGTKLESLFVICVHYSFNIFQ